MTTYVAITAGQIDGESPIDETLMTQLRDNPVAISEGDAAAPRILEPAYGASSINQAALKSTTASGSVAIGAGSAGIYVLTGGTYSWWTAGSNSTLGGMGFGNSDTAAGTIGLENPDGGSRTFYVDERYIQASPPYDLGDGEIPLFVYALMNKAGEVEGTRISQDPLWAYHGPTNIAVQIRRDGKSYRMERQYVIDGLSPIKIINGTNAAAKEKMLGRLLSDPMVEVEVDHAWKNRDMNLYPHPFMGSDLTDKTVIMLDPMSKEVEQMYAIQCGCGAQEIRDSILLNKKIIIGNSPMKRSAPNGVTIVGARWK